MPEINFKEYIHQIWKRRKIVALFLASTVTIAILVTLRQERIYRAVTVIEIGSETPDVAFFQDVVNTSPYGWWSQLKYYETQYKIIKSRALLEKVAQRAIDKGVVTGMRLDQLTAHLGGGLSIGSDEKSRLAEIYFDDTDPKRAQKLSILISEVYIDENLAQKLQGITQAVDWLNQRLDEIRQEKRRQEEELQKYKEEYKVVSLQSGENDARANLTALTTALNQLKTNRIQLEAQYTKLSELVRKSDRAEDLLGVVSSDLLTKLKQDLANLTSERSRLAHRYMEKHPTLVRLNAEISEVERLIRQEVSNEVNRIKTRYLMGKAEEDSVAKALEAQKLETLRIEEVNRRVADIQVITDTNQQLYETLQKKLKEADLSGLVRSNNIRIVDRALDPGAPIRPKVQANILFSILLGLFGGVGLALLLEYVDDTIKTNEDVERYLHLPVLGMIPHYGGTTNGNGGSGKQIEFVSIHDPMAPVAEFYRTLRTNVLFLTKAKGFKKLLIVSTGPEEGKTVTALNLSIALAQSGEKVVLLDLDLRRPKLHYSFQAANDLGVTNALVGDVTLESVIRKSEVPNLSYIFAGSIPPNPAELLGSNELKDLFAKLEKQFDRIILDSSPIAPVTDAAVVAQAADAALMVVRAGKTHRKAVLRAREQLISVKVDMLGVILNDVDIEKSTYGQYQYYKYGYSAYRSEEKEPSLPAASA